MVNIQETATVVNRLCKHTWASDEPGLAPSNVPWFYNCISHSIPKNKNKNYFLIHFWLRPGALPWSGWPLPLWMCFSCHFPYVPCKCQLPPLLAAQPLSLRKEDKGPGPTSPYSVASLGKAMTIKLCSWWCSQKELHFYDAFLFRNKYRIWWFGWAKKHIIENFTLSREI